MQFLTPSAAREQAAAIRAAFDELLDNRSAVPRPCAGQWSFLRELMDTLLGVDAAGPPLAQPLPAPRAAQYKFEVETRLRHFYLRLGRRPDYVFTLAHARDLERYGLGDDYPQRHSYAVLVRHLASDYDPAYTSPVDQIEALMADALAAEFAAYRALPELVTDPLRDFFVPDGPAMREIVTVLRGCRDKGWVLTNPDNPSTVRLKSVRVADLHGDEAIVHTTEYVYLRWWSTLDRAFAYPYREDNRQRYVVHRLPEGWRIYENHRPAPRTTAPHRRRRGNSR